MNIVPDRPLRPVGTEFWYEFGPDELSSDSSNRRILYRVVEHTRAMRFHGDTVGEPMERLEPVRMQRAPLLRMRFDGRYEYGPWEDE